MTSWRLCLYHILRNEEFKECTKLDEIKMVEDVKGFQAAVKKVAMCLVKINFFPEREKALKAFISRMFWKVNWRFRWLL